MRFLYKVLLKDVFKLKGLNFDEYQKMDKNLKNMYSDTKLSQDEKNITSGVMKNDPLYKKFLEKKIRINEISEEILGNNKVLSEYRDHFIKLISSYKDSMEFEQTNKVFFRSVKINEAGLIQTFENGLHPITLALEAYQTNTNLPFVKDAANTENIETIGYTGGVISLTASPTYAMHFANQSISREMDAGRTPEDYHLYALKPKKVANIGKHIYHNIGYSGKGESNAEASEEFVATSIESDEIFGARKLNKDGSLGPIIFNSKIQNSKSNMIGDKEFVKFAFCDSFKEFKMLEYMENPQTFKKTYGEEDTKNIDKDVENVKKDNPERYKKMAKIIGMSANHRKDFHDSKSPDKKWHKIIYEERENKKIENITGLRVKETHVDRYENRQSYKEKPYTGIS